MDKFEIGEVAVINGNWTEYCGEEVEIVSNLIPANVFHAHLGGNNTHEGYKILFSNGDDGFASKRSLDKKKPPKENPDITETKLKGAGDYDLMPWKPRELENA